MEPLDIKVMSHDFPQPDLLLASTNMIEFTIEQFFLSTEEEEKNCFYGEDYQCTPLKFNPTLPTGTYRIIDDKVCMIVPGSPISKDKIIL